MLSVPCLQTSSAEAANALQMLEEAWDESKASLSGNTKQSLVEFTPTQQKTADSNDADVAADASQPVSWPVSQAMSQPAFVTPSSKRQKLSQEGFS